MTVGERIKALRKSMNMSAERLGELIGKDRATVYRYESQEIEDMPTGVLEPLARALNTTPAYLMGWDDAITIAPQEHVHMCPVYDSAAAGFNVLAQDTIIGYFPAYITSEADKYIYINVIGDSMHPTIENGSMVLVKLQESVDSGQIAVVLIDDEEASIKRVVYGSDWIELQSINPYIPTRRFNGSDVQRVRVMGLVKKSIKDIN